MTVPQTNARPTLSGAAEPLRLSPGPETLRSPFFTVDDFLAPEEAKQLRAHIDNHFSEPQKHGPDTHQVWNYWYIPRVYTYLRTQPEKVIPNALVHKFHTNLTIWAKDRLGLGHVSWPFLSLYVNGCVQELHNDSTNGRFGYVYSLTRNDRGSRGGQTIVLKEGDLFRTKLMTADAGNGLYDLIEPTFNRLAIFDDRMPHGVQRVEGSMDPFDGRLVLHGHISEDGPSIIGTLSVTAIQKAVLPAVTEALNATGPAARLHHGPFVMRLAIGADGQVQDHRLLLDRLARPDGQSTDELADRLVAGIIATRFPEAARRSIATIPLLLGGILPWMRQQQAGTTGRS